MVFSFTSCKSNILKKKIFFLRAYANTLLLPVNVRKRLTMSYPQESKSGWCKMMIQNKHVTFTESLKQSHLPPKKNKDLRYAKMSIFPSMTQKFITPASNQEDPDFFLNSDQFKYNYYVHTNSRHPKETGGPHPERNSGNMPASSSPKSIGKPFTIFKGYFMHRIKFSAVCTLKKKSYMEQNSI